MREHGGRREEECECEEVSPAEAIAELARHVEMLKEAVERLGESLEKGTG